VVSVRVFDDGVPSLASTNQWVVVVEEDNTPPVLLSPGSQVAEARQPWKVQLQAIDSDLPVTPLTYSLVSGPPGLTVNANGLVSWTPTASQNPSTNLVVVRVRDSGPGFLRDTNRFVVVVTDRVLSPHLGIHLVVDQIIVDFETRTGWVYHLFSLPYTQAGKPNPAWELLTPTNGLIGTGALEEFILPPDLPESGVLIRMTVQPPTLAAPSGP
jgi:Putative Ig domain